MYQFSGGFIFSRSLSENIYSVTFSFCSLHDLVHKLQYSSRVFCNALFGTKEYEKLCQDPDIKHPEKHMLNNHRNSGQYQGCFSDSHWGKKRKLHKWDMFVEIAPKQAKVLTEIPNRLRSLLGVPLKHSNSKFKCAEGSHQIPDPLALAVEGLLVERMQLGEELTFDFALEVLLQAVSEWNSQLEELTSAVRQSLGPYFLQLHDENLGDDPSEEAMQAVQAAAEADLEDALSLLRPVVMSKNHASCMRHGICLQYCSLEPNILTAYR